MTVGAGGIRGGGCPPRALGRPNSQIASRSLGTISDAPSTMTKRAATTTMFSSVTATSMPLASKSGARASSNESGNYAVASKSGARASSNESGNYAAITDRDLRSIFVWPIPCGAHYRQNQTSAACWREHLGGSGAGVFVPISVAVKAVPPSNLGANQCHGSDRDWCQEVSKF
jgi:hypothetical protein